MATFISYPNPADPEKGRSSSGIRGCIVNAGDEPAARARANQLRTNGEDPDFLSAERWEFEQVNGADSGVEALVEGWPRIRADVKAVSRRIEAILQQ